jgi:two-component system sensor histidine kinase DesK
MMRPYGGSDEDDDRRISLIRRLLLGVLIVFFLVTPALGVFGHPALSGPAKWFLFIGSLVFVVLTWIYAVAPGPPGAQPVPWVPLAVILGLGIAIFIVGRENFLTVLAVAAAACGRFSSTPRPAIIAATACALAGFVVAVRTSAGFGNTVSLIAIAPMSAFFAYAAGRRIEMVNALRRTRAELARAAVAEERLRIARDLHDLLGHSLSLITLKAELAGRVIGSDPDRAAGEIAELESVARQSLSDVREAVAGFRQPDLAGELAGARTLLAAAGIAATISSAGTGSLPQNVDAALAWAIREGATNVVRHSRATKVSILVESDQVTAMAQISDNGPAAPADDGGLPAGPAGAALTSGPDGTATMVRTRPALAGSGLAGLAERVRSLGGELAARTVEPQGFLLRVVVPLSPQA